MGDTIARVCVVGLGYIGLPTAVCLAEAGLEVVGIDINPHAVERIGRGLSHLVEPGLDEALAAVVAAGTLRAVMMPEAADAYLIAVPTPVGDDTFRTPDLSYVRSAVASIAPMLRPGNLVLLESTSPVGTTDGLVEQLRLARPDLIQGEGLAVHVAYSPERVIPGRTMVELRCNDRVVGGITHAAASLAAGLYARLTTGRIYETGARTAEFVKLAENASRDVNIAFANELSMICDAQGLNVWEVIELANRHPRVDILRPGPGVGGHCIAVDPWFIVSQEPRLARVIRTAREVNDAKPDWVVRKVERFMAERPGARVACLGLTFKPDVDDFRESPALAIAGALHARFPGQVVCADPYAKLLPRHSDLITVPPRLAVDIADLVLVLVAHGEFRELAVRDGVAVLDTPGLWQPRHGDLPGTEGRGDVRPATSIPLRNAA